MRAVNAGSQGRAWFNGIPRGSVVKNLPANAGDTRDMGLIPGSGRSPGGSVEFSGQPTQYSCLENSTDRGAWRATVHGIAQSDMTEHACTSGGVESTEDLSLQWHSFLSSWPRTRTTRISAKVCQSMGLPTLDKFSPQSPRSHLPSALALHFQNLIQVWRENICVKYWLFKRMPSGKWCGSLARSLVKLWVSPELQAGNPSPGPCCPSGNPPTQGQASFYGISGRAPWWTVLETGSYIVRDGLHYWIELLQILVRNMLRLLLPPTQKSELLFKFENKYLKK